MSYKYVVETHCHHHVVHCTMTYTCMATGKKIKSLQRHGSLRFRRQLMTSYGIYVYVRTTSLTVLEYMSSFELLLLSPTTGFPVCFMNENAFSHADDAVPLLLSLLSVVQKKLSDMYTRTKMTHFDA